MYGFHHTALTPPVSWQVGFVKSLEISFLHCLSKVAPSYLSSPFPFVWVILGRRLSALGLRGPFGGRYMPLCLGFSLHTWVGLKSSARNIVSFFLQHPSYNGACFVYMLCFLTFVGKKWETMALISKQFQINIGRAPQCKNKVTRICETVHSIH